MKSTSPSIAIGVARIVAGERRHRQRGVLDGAGDRALEDEGHVAAEGFRPGHQRHAPEGGLVSKDAAPGRRDADRAAAVGALAERQQARRHRAGAAAGRAAGVLRQVEGILRRAVEVVVAGAAEAEDRAVGLSDEDRAGLLHPLDEHAVVVDDVVLERADAAEGRDPARLEVEAVLHRDRHAVQRADLVAAHDRGFRRLRRLPRVVVAEDDQRIDFRVVLLDPGDRRVRRPRPAISPCGGFLPRAWRRIRSSPDLLRLPWFPRFQSAGSHSLAH